MQIRRFSPDVKTKIPGNHPGLHGVPIQLSSTQVPQIDLTFSLFS
jgi:hypothetical protein